MRRAHPRSKPYINRKGPASHGVADTRLESAITHPFNIMRHLDTRDHESFIKIQREAQRYAPFTGVYYRQLGRAGITLLSRNTINRAAEWSVKIHEMPTDVLKSELRDALPSTSRRLITNALVIGAKVLDNGSNGHSLVIRVEPKGTNAEHERLVNTLNTIGSLELIPSPNAAHVSLARFTDEYPSDELLDAVNKKLPKYVSFLPVRFIDQSQQFFDPQQD